MFTCFQFWQLMDHFFVSFLKTSFHLSFYSKFLFSFSVLDFCRICFSGFRQIVVNNDLKKERKKRSENCYLMFLETRLLEVIFKMGVLENEMSNTISY